MPTLAATSAAPPHRNDSPAPGPARSAIEPSDDRAPYRPLARRARWTLGLLAVGILVDVVAPWSGARERSLLAHIATGDVPSEAEISASDTRQAVIGAIQGVLFTLTAAAFLAWFYRAYTNLPPLGAADLRYGRRWAIGAWFVPILNLWRPKQIANDIWRASDPDAPDSEGGAWRKGRVPRFFALRWK